MPKHQQANIISSEEINRKALERTLQRTVTLLKAAENSLPSSVVKGDSNLIPNSVSTKTFEQGHTLHTLLCGAYHPPVKSASKMEQVGQQGMLCEEGNYQTRIPIYRKLNSITDFSISGPSMQQRTPLMEQNKTGPGPRRKLDFSTSNQNTSPLLQNQLLDEDGYSIPHAEAELFQTPQNGNFMNRISQTLSMGSLTESQKNQHSNKSRLSGQATDGEEYFESAYEESFETEEREKREQSARYRYNISNGHKTHHFEMIEGQGQYAYAERTTTAINLTKIGGDEDERTLTSITANTTLMTELGRNVNELKEVLVNATDKLDTVVNQIDRTLNESFPDENEDESERSFGFGRQTTIPKLTFAVETKTTQTPETWKNKTTDVQAASNLLQRRKSLQAVPAPLNLVTKNVRLSESQTRMTELRVQCMILMKQAIEALREYYRVQLYLCQEEQQHSSKEEKAAYVAKLKKLVEEFDEKKKKIKTDFRNKEMDKGILGKYVQQTNKWQTETIRLNARLQTLRQLFVKNEKPLQSISARNNYDRRGSSAIGAIEQPVLEQPELELEEQEKKDQVEDGQSKSKSAESPELEASSTARGSLNNDSSLERTSAEIESIPDELPSERTFEPCEKSLQSVLVSARNNSLSTGCESYVQHGSSAIGAIEQPELEEQEKKDQIKDGQSKSAESEEVEAISAARDNSNNDSSLERTSAEIESIPEELPTEQTFEPCEKSILISAGTNSLSTGRESYDQRGSSAGIGAIEQPVLEQPELEEQEKKDQVEDGQLKPAVEDGRSMSAESEELEASSTAQGSLNNDSSLQRTSAEIESIPEELPTERTFEPCEKSLQSILVSARTNNSLSTGRDSYDRRRSSVSEALLKLRLMNGVPTLPKSPRESKSPQKTPRSPPGLERFTTKFPQSLSRETSFNDELIQAATKSEHFELLDELPNTSQLGMLLDISQSPATEKSRASILANRRLSVFSHQRDKSTQPKELLEKWSQKLWKALEDNGEYDFDDECLHSGMMDDSVVDENEEYSEDDGTIPIIMLRQLCCEYVRNLIQTTSLSAVSRHVLSSQKTLADYLQMKLLGNEPAICSNGIRARSDKTSHVLVDTNRLLLAQYTYETMGMWPNAELQKYDLSKIDEQALNDQEEDKEE